MEDELHGVVPCSSLAVDSILRVGTAGALWGLCMGPYDARKLGLTGVARASFVAKTVGKFGFQCGLVAGIYTVSRCGIQRYRGRNDWLRSEIMEHRILYPRGVTNFSRKILKSECRTTSCSHIEVNGLVGGAVAGAAVAARTRNWTQVIGMAGLVSAFSAAADYSRTS